MAVTINGIVCQEIVASYREAADFGTGVTARKGFLCNWADRFTVAKGLLGLTTGAIKRGPVTVTVGAAHPELQYCFVNSVEFEPKGRPQQGAKQLAFDMCIVWANFGPGRNVQWGAVGFGDGTHGFIFAEQKIAVSHEVVTIPGRRAKFKTSNETIKTEVGTRIGLAELEITLHAMPFMPDYTVFEAAGKINAAPFLGVDTGKLMFNGITTQEAANTDGTYTLEGTYSFTARTQRWDYAYDGLTSRWDQVVMLDGTTPLITSADFAPIFPVGYAY